MGNSAMAVQRLMPGEEEIYRAFRIYALGRYPAAFTSSAEEARALPHDWYAKRIAAADDPRQFLIGAFAGDLLVGTAGLVGGERQSERHKASLYGMAVHEEFAGRGVGRNLVRTLITEARTIPTLRQINLSLTKGNDAAERLYRACGFQACGCEPRATLINGTFHDKLMMVLLLD